jgi:hypothetical protein
MIARLTGLLRRELTKMSWLEWAAVLLTIVVAIDFLRRAGLTWQSISLTIGMLVLGLLAGSMVYDLWFGRR